MPTRDFQRVEGHTYNYLIQTSIRNKTTKPKEATHKQKKKHKTKTLKTEQTL